ncbi:hypothetical protein [Phascolarctobacterium faecium]|uniref:hypothetical protein n=1 Tax=Phascolarctobacterium faecium TaxID=33025 RepID=UPI003522F603
MRPVVYNIWRWQEYVFTVTLIIAQYLKTQLGGLTGDTYGALTECGNGDLLTDSSILTKIRKV